MKHRGSRARRSVGEWSVRLVLAGFAVILGYAVVPATFAYSIRSNDTLRAHALAPGDGRITALYAASLLESEDTASTRGRVDRLAALALKQDPVAATAATTLGINAQLRGDTPLARRAFRYAMALTRRDLQSQLWGIEDAVSRGDVAGALRQYDIALRTSRHAPDLLFPVLASAIADGRIRSALAHTLSTRPPWGNGFIDYVAGNGPDPQSIASLLIDLARVGVRVSDVAQRAAVDGLAQGGRHDQAWAYYRLIRHGAKQIASRDPYFAVRLESPSVFDWRYFNDVGISTSIQPGGKGGIFDFSASTGVGGTLLEQMQLLPTGRYRLIGSGENVAADGTALPYWTLICQPSNIELGRIVVSVSPTGAGSFDGYFDVPARCPVQILRLVARPSDAVGGVSGQIGQAQLLPVLLRQRPQQ